MKSLIVVLAVALAFAAVSPADAQSPTLELTLGSPPSFGAFRPCVTATYEATTFAVVNSTAGDALLSVHDASATASRHLVNGPFSLAHSLQARGRNASNTATAYHDVGTPGSPLNLLSYGGPVSNDHVALDFRQFIAAFDSLVAGQAGTYGKELTFTLSTTTPVPMSTTATLFVSGDLSASCLLFLHADGANLFIDRNAATDATADFRDSAALNFAAGNAWKTIGTWAVAATDRPGTFSAGELHAWLGLKTSDDQGTRFDLRAEVLKNGDPIASGTSNCITGVTRNPGNATEVFVPLTGEEADIGPTDALSLRVSARIGTNSSGAFCGGHRSAAGLRLYFDAATRPTGITLE